jgi:hypothetical protein
MGAIRAWQNFGKAPPWCITLMPEFESELAIACGMMHPRAKSSQKNFTEGQKENGTEIII